MDVNSTGFRELSSQSDHAKKHYLLVWHILLIFNIFPRELTLKPVVFVSIRFGVDDFTARNFVDIFDLEFVRNCTYPSIIYTNYCCSSSLVIVVEIY